MNKYNASILVLCISAAVLAALVIGSYVTQPAQASSASIKGGEYILGTASMKDSVDMITVIDTNMQRMMIYVPDKTGSPSRIDVGDSVDLRRAFGDRPRP